MGEAIKRREAISNGNETSSDADFHFERTILSS